MIAFFAFSPGQLTPAYIVNHDKAAHAVVFFILSWMMRRSFPAMTMRKMILTVGLLALGIEVIQFLFANRGFSAEDMIYNALGISLYVILAFTRRRVSNYVGILQAVSKK